MRAQNVIITATLLKCKRKFQNEQFEMQLFIPYNITVKTDIADEEEGRRHSSESGQTRSRKSRPEQRAEAERQR